MADLLTEEALTEAFEYLDELRESGRTNMFAAPMFVRDELGWDKGEATAATKLWMNTFSLEPVEARIAEALASHMTPASPNHEER